MVTDCGTTVELVIATPEVDKPGTVVNVAVVTGILVEVDFTGVGVTGSWVAIEEVFSVVDRSVILVDVSVMVDKVEEAFPGATVVVSGDAVGITKSSGTSFIKKFSCAWFDPKIVMSMGTLGGLPCISTCQASSKFRNNI